MKPRVTLKCQAHRFASKDERIIEFFHEGVGGLISFFPTANGGLKVYIYRHDTAVQVQVGTPRD